ncbi:hypothetical protein ACS0TY_007113 [Phlomoides rotata]
MAAHGAVVSLVQLLKQLLKSGHFPTPEIQSLHDNVFSLQSSLERIFPVQKRIHRSAANDLEIQIRDAIYKAQDSIESFIFNQNLPSSEEITGDQYNWGSISLQEITETLDPIAEMAEKLAGIIGPERDNLLSGDESQPSKSFSGSKSTRIVGQEEDKKVVTEELLREEDKLQVIPISGMAGIGKTTLATSIYDDRIIKSQFAFRAWVTVTQDYHVGEILARLLNSMESRGQKAGDRVFQGSDEQLGLNLYQSLYNNRYLVVIDDMWGSDVWDRVRRSLPDNENGSRILLTTRILNVARSVKTGEFYHQMKHLGEEDSWTLLCEKTFGDMNCPPHLEKTGREIAKNCGGLPLSLTVIGGLLSQERKTEEYWQSIEEDTNAAASKGEDSYLEILSLSYNHLPGKLKGCFLYMGAFPEDSQIPVSRLIKLWVAEGFLIPSLNLIKSLEKVAEGHLEDLIERNLILIHKNSSDGRIKACGMHDSLRDLSVQESRKEKFFHSVKRHLQENELGTENQRRLCIHRNVLMCLKDVYKSTKSITVARTVVYAGPHHPHPMPSCLTFDLLRVLDAFTVYFIRFPYDLIKLIHLRYLSLTYSGKLPPSLSKLQNLQTLIVGRQPKIISAGKSFLPDEIWNMPQLRHLLISESDFPKIPGHKPLLLANLQSLSSINAACCTKEVLQNFPSLKKFGMWIVRPGDVAFYLADELKQLEAFKFTVLNPILGRKMNFLPKLDFPKTLRKLSLSGCGLPWEDMGVIARLPLLQVLKLRELAFKGEAWCPSSDDYIFEELKFLLLEYLDFKIWDASDSHFPSLKRLIIRHCYRLDEIPPNIGFIGGLELIELVECSRLAVESAEEISDVQESYDNRTLQVRTYSSW